MNVKNLRDDLIRVYEQLKSGEIGIDEAKQLANVSGKIMATAKSQMEYNKMTGNKKNAISFMEVEDGN